MSQYKKAYCYNCRLDFSTLDNEKIDKCHKCHFKVNPNNDKYGLRVYIEKHAKDKATDVAVDKLYDLMKSFIRSKILSMLVVVTVAFATTATINNINTNNRNKQFLENPDSLVNDGYINYVDLSVDVEDEGFEIMLNNLGERDYKLLNEGYRLKPDGSAYKYKRKGMNFEDAFNKSVNLLNKSRKEKTAEKVRNLYNELDELGKKDSFLALGNYFSRNQLIEVKERGYEREVIYIIRPDYLDFKLPFLSIESAATYIANTLYKEFDGPKPTEDIIDQHKRGIRRSIRKRSGLVAGFGVVGGGKLKMTILKSVFK